MRPIAATLLAIMSSLPLAPHARADASFVGNGTTATLGCHGDAARVRGSGNRLTLWGGCRALALNGSDNVVTVDLVPGATVRIAGDRNRVLYPPVIGGPASSTGGVANVVLPGPFGPAATPPGDALGPVLIDATTTAFDVSCAGRDVLIRGNNLRATLRGGCLSVTVQGRSDAVLAELVPGAVVAIGGPAVLLNYVLVRNGPPPRVSVTAPGLQAAQIQHDGASDIALATAGYRH